MKVALCLLTWNELEGCKADVPRLPLDGFDEVYAVDGGSTDGTVEYLESQGISVREQQLRGYNGAIISCRLEATADAVVLFHPKGTIEPSVITDLLARLRAGDGLVVASRLAKEGVNEEDSKLLKPRKWFVVGLALVASILFRRKGPILWDVLHGVRAFSVDAFDAMELRKTGLAADLEMVVRSYRLNIQRSEVPAIETPRIAGETHFAALPTGWKLLKYLGWEIRRGKPTAEAKRKAASSIEVKAQPSPSAAPQPEPTQPVGAGHDAH